jgi:hypothetical protein
MTQCAALVFHPDAFTGRGKMVPARCGQYVTTGSIWCHQHAKMIAAGVVIKRYDRYVSRMPAAIPFDGTKNFLPPVWIPDWLANEGVRIPPSETPAPNIDHDEEEELIAD